jgi:hypothetical protein
MRCPGKSIIHQHLVSFFITSIPPLLVNIFHITTLKYASNHAIDHREVIQYFKNPYPNSAFLKYQCGSTFM